MAKGRNAARGAKSSGSPEGLNPQQLRKLTAALSKATSLPALLKLHATHGPSFNGFHVGALWKRLKHLAVSAQGQSYLLSNSSQLVPLCIQTSQMLPTLNTRAIATVALAMSSAGLLRGLPWEEVWPLIRESTAAKLSQFEPRELADVAWSFALVGGKFSHPCLPICHTPLFVTRLFLSRATFCHAPLFFSTHHTAILLLMWSRSAGRLRGILWTTRLGGGGATGSFRSTVSLQPRVGVCRLGSPLR